MYKKYMVCVRVQVVKEKDGKDTETEYFCALVTF